MNWDITQQGLNRTHTSQVSDYELNQNERGL